MSEFQELIKSFSKSREYVRDFFVYGFKTRDDFSEKSGRTYDNERRRIESWLSEYIHSEYTKNGKNISIAMDSNLLLTNPLYRVWKSKSFTDNDIMLHFFLLDIMQDKEPRTIEELTNEILANYDVLFEPQLVRKKVKEYEEEGLLICQKSGKQHRYLCADNLAYLIPEELPALLEAIGFYHIAAPLGILGSTILDNQKTANDIFTAKHGFFGHTLEDEMLLVLLDAMREKRAVTLIQRSSKSKQIQKTEGAPLKIFVSTRTGRRYLCLYNMQGRRFTNIRLDSIKEVSLLDVIPTYMEHEKDLENNLSKVFGVSFGTTRGTNTIKMTLYIHEKTEDFILQRLEREGKGGIITHIGENTYSYEKEVFDGNEMMPWIKTFTGRILSFESNNPYLKRKFYGDMRQMAAMYED
ncbi:MAG: WYL domain-containing protein [Lachnospiraceae bacterium]|nr:WYL domain-containing protein [Lachnospiraceae bacterium]